MIGDVIREGCRKVINVAALSGRFFERDVTAIPRKQTLNRISLGSLCAICMTRTMISESIECWASAAAITVLWGDEFWPFSAMTRMTFRHHMSHFSFGPHLIA